MEWNPSPAAVLVITTKKKESREMFEAELKLRPKNIKNIEALETTLYPASVNGPDFELSFPVEPGRFSLSGMSYDWKQTISSILMTTLGTSRYHRSFLLQFMNVCTERPISLVPLDSVGLEPCETSTKYPGGARPDRRRVGVKSAAGAPMPHGRGPSSLSIGSGPGLSRPGFSLANFRSPPRWGDSQSRFEASNLARFDAVPSANVVPDYLTSKTWSRGGLRGGDTRAQCGSNRRGNVGGAAFQIPTSQTANLEPVAPLKQSENRWVPRNPQTPRNPRSATLKCELKVGALLNKLTAKNFDLLSNRIINWANKSEHEKDGATLKQIIRLIFEHAKGGAVFSETYARLCRNMVDRISPQVQDKMIRNSEGQPITGGMLLRKYLLNQCQEDFENRWDAKRAALAIARSTNGGTSAIPNSSAERGSYSRDDYMPIKANRQCVGLVRFMGELFRLQIVTERIIHECVKSLLSNVVKPEEGDIEGLCQLLMAIGQLLDTPGARSRMDSYLERIQEMAGSNQLSFRMRFMLLDVTELYARYWQPHHADPLSIPGYPMTNSSRNESGAGIRRGERRGNHTGWSVGAGTSRPSPRAGNLSQFGKISKPTGVQFGPSSVFNRGAAPGAGERKKLNLLPRTKPIEAGMRRLP